MDTDLPSWSVRAVNLPEHGDNPVHTDDGARAAGHERALVAGTTVHAYLTCPAVAGWGAAWLTGGGSEVRFRSPVFDDDLVDLVPSQAEAADLTPGTVRIEARSRGAVRATLDVWHGAPEPGPMRGDRLPTLVAPFDDDLAGYARRSGADTSVTDALGVVHPVVATVLGNRATKASVVDGPWIHVRSRITHQGLARPGDVGVVESSLVARFGSRAGERALLDVRVTVDERPIMAIEHESIVRLA